MAGKRASKADILKELLRFLWRERLWWLVPMAVVLVALGLLMAIAQQSAVVPFVYTLF